MRHRKRLKLSALWRILHWDTEGIEPARSKPLKSHKVFDLLIICTRSAEWWKSKTLWDLRGWLRAGSIPSVSQCKIHHFKCLCGMPFAVRLSTSMRMLGWPCAGWSVKASFRFKLRHTSSKHCCIRPSSRMRSAKRKSGGYRSVGTEEGRTSY